MAVSFLAAIYGINANASHGATGQYISFPAASVLVRPVTTDSTFNGVFTPGVTVKSIIQLLPAGTVVNQPQYYTSLTVDQVNTLRNA